MKKLSIFFLIVCCAFSLFAQAKAESSINEEIKIVSLGPNVTEILYALGCADNVVGRTDYCNYPQEALTVQSIGNLWEPNLELILGLDADIAIASSLIDPTFIESLTKAGITAYQFNEQESLEGTYNLIENIAEVVNKQEQAKAIIDNMKTRIQEVKSKINTLNEKKKVVYIISYGDYGDYAATGDTYLNDVIEAAGGINAAQSGMYWSISKELLFEQNPDVILISSYGDPASDIQTFVNTTPYNQLDASINGQVYTINQDAAERQGVRTVDAIEEFARILYPQLF